MIEMIENRGLIFSIKHWQRPFYSLSTEDESEKEIDTLSREEPWAHEITPLTHWGGAEIKEWKWLIFGFITLMIILEFLNWSRWGYTMTEMLLEVLSK